MARRLNSLDSGSIVEIGGDAGTLEIGVSSSSSSFEHVLRMVINISVIFSPTKDVHEIWKPEEVRRTIELPDIRNIVLVPCLLSLPICTITASLASWRE
jgi:hypothetical protein